MINTLVTHKKFDLGIGCISKELKNSYKVNFGRYDVKTCSKNSLNIINTDECKTIKFAEFRDRILMDHSKLNICIVGNELKEYVGIGWVTIRVINYDDLTKYPRVI